MRVWWNFIVEFLTKNKPPNTFENVGLRYTLLPNLEQPETSILAVNNRKSEKQKLSAYKFNTAI